MANVFILLPHHYGSPRQKAIKRLLLFLYNVVLIHIHLFGKCAYVQVLIWILLHVYIMNTG